MSVVCIITFISAYCSVCEGYSFSIGWKHRCLYVYSVDPNDQKKTACYDIDVEVEDPLKTQMSNFLLSTANQQEIASLDNKVPETVLHPHDQHD